MNSIKEYNYVYKTTNLINNMFYIGVHSTNDINDNYLGSGLRFLYALKKYGKNNFKKEILFFCKSRVEALEEEKKIVTTSFIEQKDTYNLVLGGIANGGQSIWNGPNSEKARKILSEANKGYKNHDFIKNWMPIYESLAPMVCFYSCCTNLPDRFIRKLVLSKTGVSINIHRLLNYYEHKCYLQQKEKIHWSDYFGMGYVPKQKAAKTICSPIHNKIETNNIIYKSFHSQYLNDFNEIKTILNDKTISDSMLFSNSIKSNFGTGGQSRIKYFEYLGLIKEENKIKINIRKRFPNAQRSTGSKTIYRFNKVKNLLTIANNGEYNEYLINFDGEFIQKIRLRNQRYANWRND